MELTEQHDRQVQSLQQEVVLLEERRVKLTEQHERKVLSLQQELGCMKERCNAQESTIENMMSLIQKNKREIEACQTRSSGSEKRRNSGSRDDRRSPDKSLNRQESSRGGTRNSDEINPSNQGQERVTSRKRNASKDDEVEHPGEKVTISAYLKHARQNSETLASCSSSESRNRAQSTQNKQTSGSRANNIPLERKSPTNSIIQIDSSPISVVGHVTAKRLGAGGNQHSTPRRESSPTEELILSGQRNQSMQQLTKTPKVRQTSKDDQTTQVQTVRNQTRSYKEALLCRRESLSNQRRKPVRRAPRPFQPRPTYNSKQMCSPERDESNKSADLADFVGVERTRVKRKRFFLGYLKKTDPLKLQSMVHKFARNKGVQLTFVRIMASKQKDTAFARINVPVEQAHLVVEDNFWPNGVKCRAWVSENTYRNKDLQLEPKAQCNLENL
ncbi:hypothetical protein Bbelb_039910 [Branchiostoma belcheri]|nr:hypothetical protein Bbelb_039910 [Branchiostoma belcheri]